MAVRFNSIGRIVFLSIFKRFFHNISQVMQDGVFQNYSVVLRSLSREVAVCFVNIDGIVLPSLSKLSVHGIYSWLSMVLKLCSFST